MPHVYINVSGFNAVWVGHVSNFILVQRHQQYHYQVSGGSGSWSHVHSIHVIMRPVRFGCVAVDMGYRMPALKPRLLAVRSALCDV